MNVAPDITLGDLVTARRPVSDLRTHVIPIGSARPDALPMGRAQTSMHHASREVTHETTNLSPPPRVTPAALMLRSCHHAARHSSGIDPGKDFDDEYVNHAVIPFFLSSIYEGERPLLPMIDVTLTKQNALPFDLWGLIYKDWKPTPEEGVTVFLQGLEKRGANNLRKRIYMSAVTPDLYHSMYQEKVVRFFDQLLDLQFVESC